MTPRRRGAVAAIAGAVLVTALVGCDQSNAPPTTTAPPVEVSIPSGDATELLPVMSTELSRLSSQVGGDLDDATLARVQAMWVEIRREVEQTRPELLDQFERALALADNAVTRKRPADADKSFTNFSRLVDLYLGEG